MNLEKYVSHDNNLVFGGTDLTALEIDIFCTLVSKIDFEAKEFSYLDFSIKDYYAAKGIQNINYTRVKNQCNTLYNKSLVYENKDIREDVHIFSKRIINKGDGTISLKFSEDIRPYLLKLHTNYNTYQLKHMIPLLNEYCKIMYDYFSSKKNMNFPVWEITEPELRALLNLKNKYKLYTDLKKRVIDVFINDINDKTDLIIKFLPGPKLRNRDRKLKFSISKKVTANGETPLAEDWFRDGRLADTDIDELKRIARHMTDNTSTTPEEYLQGTYVYCLRTPVRTTLFAKMKNTLEGNFINKLQFKIEAKINPSSIIRGIPPENSTELSEEAQKFRKQHMDARGVNYEE